jgi:hypothetical protein
MDEWNGRWDGSLAENIVKVHELAIVRFKKMKFHDQIKELETWKGNLLVKLDEIEYDQALQDKEEADYQGTLEEF